MANPESQTPANAGPVSAVAPTFPNQNGLGDSDALPLVANKYRVGNLLAVGGMGRVYQGEHIALRVPVAIKVLRKDLAQRPEFITRFLREARAAASLRSPHSVQIFDVASEEDGSPYIVMELIEGEDLERIIETNGPMVSNRAVDCIIQLLLLLEEAHSKGLVHRDIKPANLTLTKGSGRDGREQLKVLDFGISKTLETDEDIKLTGANALLGSPAYMPPEQLRDATAADARSDIWSCGVTLYELLSGQIPFDGSGVPELCANIISGTPKPLPASTNVPQGLASVITRCLERDPKQRPQTAAELALLLAPYATSEAETRRMFGQEAVLVASASPKRNVLLPVVVGAAIGLASFALFVARSDTFAKTNPTDLSAITTDRANANPSTTQTGVETIQSAPTTSPGSIKVAGSGSAIASETVASAHPRPSADQKSAPKFVEKGTMPKIVPTAQKKRIQKADQVELME
jgi:serine/threonine protein kinase